MKKIYIIISMISSIAYAQDITKKTLTGVDGNFDNFIKFGHKEDLESGTSNVNRWHGIDATISAGYSSINKLIFRMYAGGANNDLPVNIMTLLGNGNVGIGTANPQSKLEVNGDISIPISSSILIAGFQPFHGLRYSNKEFGDTFVDGPVLYGWSGGALGIKKENGEWIALKWTESGNVSVRNKLEAREIKVTESPTADFVFEESYDLPTLQEVEKYIKEKKHLPEVPSAKEMEKDGVNVGEFQIKLLQKIEELTLYIIEQNKELKQQHQQIEKLKQINH